MPCFPYVRESLETSEVSAFTSLVTTPPVGLALDRLVRVTLVIYVGDRARGGAVGDTFKLGHEEALTNFRLTIRGRWRLYLLSVDARRSMRRFTERASAFRMKGSFRR